MNKWVVYDHDDWFEVQYHCGHYVISIQAQDKNSLIKDMFETKKNLKCEYCNEKKCDIKRIRVT